MAHRPKPTGITYRAERDDYEQGDERSYYVLYRRTEIGVIERFWMPAPIPNDPPIAGWSFVHIDGRRGEGRTRNAAVADALGKTPDPERTAP